MARGMLVASNSDSEIGAVSPGCLESPVAYYCRYNFWFFRQPCPGRRRCSIDARRNARTCTLFRPRCIRELLRDVTVPRHQTTETKLGYRKFFERWRGFSHQLSVDRAGGRPRGPHPVAGEKSSSNSGWNKMDARPAAKSVENVASHVPTHIIVSDFKGARECEEIGWRR